MTKNTITIDAPTSWELKALSVLVEQFRIQHHRAGEDRTLGDLDREQLHELTKSAWSKIRGDRTPPFGSKKEFAEYPDGWDSVESMPKHKGKATIKRLSLWELTALEDLVAEDRDDICKDGLDCDEYDAGVSNLAEHLVDRVTKQHELASDRWIELLDFPSGRVRGNARMNVTPAQLAKSHPREPEEHLKTES